MELFVTHDIILVIYVELHFSMALKGNLQEIREPTV